MLDIVQALRPKLTKLELPFEWRDERGFLVPVKTGLSFLDCTALRSMTLPASVSANTAWKAFPNSLQLLRVVDDNDHENIQSAVHGIVQGQTRLPPRNPNLEYFHVHCARPWQKTSKSRMCRQVGPTQVMMHRHPMVSPQQIRQVYGLMS